jgi:hypothetical protein
MDAYVRRPLRHQRRGPYILLDFIQDQTKEALSRKIGRSLAHQRRGSQVPFGIIGDHVSTALPRNALSPGPSCRTQDEWRRTAWGLTAGQPLSTWRRPAHLMGPQQERVRPNQYRVSENAIRRTYE